MSDSSDASSAWRLTATATAGFILNPGQNATEPGPLGRDLRVLLQDLARQVRDVAALPVQAARRELWYRHIALEPTRPLSLVFLEDSWEEVFPAEGNLQITDRYWRQWEWYLRHLLFRHVHIDDDFVIEPDLYVPVRLRSGDWGLPPTEYESSADAHGSYRWTPVLSDPDDIRTLTPASLDLDRPGFDREMAAVQELFAGILPVHPHCAPSSMCLIDIAAHLRGTEQLMLDMYDRPEWLHELMTFIAGEEQRRRQFLEGEGVLTLNNRNHYVDAGGIGYTRELPAADFDGSHVRLSDLWCHAAAQAASEIGPEHHEEFILEHELPILEAAGLCAYGCCEPYTRKFGVLKRRVPNLRRVSVSPWCDVERAAAELTDRYIFSWKPNPALLVGQFDEGRVRNAIRHTLEVARDCRLEIILKDTITLDHDPRRLQVWNRIVREEIESTSAST